MKMLQRIAAISLIASLAASGGAFAQTPKATEAAADKQVISKECSKQADAKGLHGKARKHFRSECKRHGGKAE
jgi:psiF repeat